MAGRDAPKKDNARGRTKAQNRAGTQTARNKAQRISTLASRHRAAQTRRDSEEYIVPMQAMVPLSKLPRKFQSKWREDHPENVEADPLVADPKRGMKLRLPETVRDARAAQTARVARKRAQRRTFAALKPAERRAHREAGQKQFGRQTAVQS